MKIANKLIRKIQNIIGRSSNAQNNASEFREFLTFAISFPFSEEITAQYLSLVLKSLNIKSYLYERSHHSNLLPIPDSVRFYFLIVPSKYHDLFNPESYALENEVRWIVRNNPRCCLIFVQTLEELGNKRIEDLVSSAKRASQSSVDVITFSNHDSFLTLLKR